jgi:hypothetical protein
LSKISGVDGRNLIVGVVQKHRFLKICSPKQPLDQIRDRDDLYA